MRYPLPLFAPLIGLIALTALITLNWPGTAHALNPKEMFADPAMEERARTIGRELRCMVCQNQSIFDSNAGLESKMD